MIKSFFSLLLSFLLNSCVSFVLILIFFSFLFFSQAATTQNSSAANKAASSLNEYPIPTWNTQRNAKTFQLTIPAPRGQITDRHGAPLAQNRSCAFLALQFPTPLVWKDPEILSFAKGYIKRASEALHHPIDIKDQKILDHYHHRGLLPLPLIEELQESEVKIIKKLETPYFVVGQTYMRYYPEHDLAAGIIGYVGEKAPLPLRDIENNDLLFPQTEGRDGLEQVFNNQLTGSPGILSITYDEKGKKSSERIVQKPVAGSNVITTLDLNLEKECKKVLEQQCRKGAIIFLDPNSGEVLAMASQPSFDLNDFVPFLDAQVFQNWNSDPDTPLLPRAFRASYPPGSIFKPVVGIAALESGIIKPTDTFHCLPTLQVGNFTFHNWKKVDAGYLNLAQALTESCNTWFYQCGLKISAKPIIEWSHHLGLGSKTGIPILGEATGKIPDNAYMKKTHHRPILAGDIANMSIGQGDILVTPLQMAQMMAIIAAEGNFHQTRLVKQLQQSDHEVIAAYPDRIKTKMHWKPEVVKTLRPALVSVTEGDHGTAHRAQVKGIHVAGKTGTAQWGPKGNQRTLAWFGGFVPAEHPQYAFVALYEGEPEDHSVHGGSQAAPMIAKVLEFLYHTTAAQAEATPTPSPSPAQDQKNQQHPADPQSQQGRQDGDQEETTTQPIADHQASLASK